MGPYFTYTPKLPQSTSMSLGGAGELVTLGGPILRHSAGESCETE